MDDYLALRLPTNSPIVALVNAVLAIGCRSVQRRMTHNTTKADQEPLAYHTIALASRTHLTDVQPSIITIQVGNIPVGNTK